MLPFLKEHLGLLEDSLRILILPVMLLHIPSVCIRLYINTPVPYDTRVVSYIRTQKDGEQYKKISQEKLPVEG
jgi:hypothetical protein